MEEGEIACEDGEVVPQDPSPEEAHGAGDSEAAAPMIEESETAASNSYYCPVVHLEPPPQRIYHLYRQFRNAKNVANNFFKGVKWSPDGSCWLTSNEDKSLRLFDLPSNILEIQPTTSTDDEDPLQSTLTIYEGESVYDFCWYPHMVATDSTTCVFATTSRDHPVHLWDAATGKLRCTYRAYDAADEITAAISVAFNPAGTKLFCGYYKKLRIFDTSTPGRVCEEHSSSKKSRDGLTGLISTLAFNGQHQSLLAAGSYDRSVALYDEGTMAVLYKLQGHEGGVTQVQFSKDGNYLYSGARKDPNILCWDVRYLTDVVYKLERQVTNTNQRISFDIEPYGHYLGTGGEDGEIRFFDLQTGLRAGSIASASDTINGFSFHPSYPLAISTSGQRRFASTDEENDETPEYLTDGENCASFWRFSCSWAEIKM